VRKLENKIQIDNPINKLENINSVLSWFAEKRREECMSKEVEMLMEMAMTRDQWINSVRKRIEGAVGEYAKLKYYDEYGLPDFWSNEVRGLVTQIAGFFKKKTKTSFNMDIAFIEAFDDAKGCQDQVVGAKNQILHSYLKTPMQREKFLKFFRGRVFDCDELMIEMFKEYSPEIYTMIKNNQEES
jgi:hypothetical protein